LAELIARLDQGLVRVARVGALVGLWIIGVSLTALVVRAYVFEGYAPVGFDAHAYWVAGRSSSPYDAPPQAMDAFLYSPAFKQLVTPVSWLPFPIFYGLWAVLEGTAFAWLLKPLGWRWGGASWLLCVPELLIGNVIGFICVCAVLGLRRPELWSFPLLTKITGGLVGGVWFLARGDWRSIVRLVGSVIVVAGLSIAVSPGLWRDWFDFLQRNSGNGHGLLVRAAIALVFVVVGARTRRPWLLAPALLLSTPVLAGNSVMAFLATIPRLVRDNSRAGDEHS
jgi:hypothetical protein